MCLWLFTRLSLEPRVQNDKYPGTAEDTGHRTQDTPTRTTPGSPATRPSFLICTRGDSSGTLGSTLGPHFLEGFLCFIAWPLEVIFPQLIGGCMYISRPRRMSVSRQPQCGYQDRFSNVATLTGVQYPAFLQGPRLNTYFSPSVKHK